MDGETYKGLMLSILPIYYMIRTQDECWYIYTFYINHSITLYSDFQTLFIYYI